ncbi:MAG: hypothetical protein OQJ89_09825 [Kangiellaceae bacterium]|nr:hypothetical protein [Kangiellaceae bacterium]MCW9017253.1 hypothetical protein [Kangiellaceae bacterium]
MVIYYVNRSSRSEGQHEVHTSSCPDLPEGEETEILGSYSSVQEALKEALYGYERVVKCKWCCEDLA